MAGRFILSLDCEGKWGVADHLTAAHHQQLSDASLRQSYRAIGELLDRYEMAATFAIVGLFTLTREELRALPRGAIEARLDYTKPAFEDLLNGSGEGWSGAWIDDMLDPRHERALHGVTHTPFDRMKPDDADFEFSIIPLRPGQTFIYPRGRVAHVDALARAGIVGYRLARPSNRWSRLAGEFNVLAASEPDPPPGDPQPIPSGYFVNWLSGARKAVPIPVSRRRARHIIADAARTGGVAHFWTHPENVASAPATLDVLRAVLEEAASARDRGEIVVMTQRDYVTSLR